jgi:hypothetical protein
MGTKWSTLNTLETKMAKISHTKIKQPSFGEKRSKLTYTQISRFTVYMYMQTQTFCKTETFYMKNCERQVHKQILS